VSEFDPEVNQTVEQMWEAFLHQATRNRPGRKVPIEVRLAYYAGCHNMLAKILALFRAGEAKSGEWQALFRKWSDELTQFSNDYRDGKV
jgi:hypothetical protein